MKLSFVVQRYGAHVRGGAETHCRMFCERLVERGHDVQVLTSRAADYTTWSNDLPGGTSVENGVTVRRFGVARERGDAFHRLSGQVLPNPSAVPHELGEEWMRLQGPEVPDLVATIERERDDVDLLVFFTYLYYTTYFGLPAAGDRAVLHPTAHDEPPIRLPIFPEMFRRPRAFVYNTPEERDFVSATFGVGHVPHVVLGIGVSPPDDVDPDRFRASHGISDPFLLYVGRLDEAKGSEHLCEWFAAYKRRRPGPLKLVLAGEKVYVPDDHPDVVYVGKPDDSEKWDAMAAATVFVLPSFYESFSMVLLESWAVGTPALVNGRADVLVGHSRRSTAGLWYASYPTFEAALDRLLGSPELRAALGSAGRRYATERYGWDAIIDRYVDFLEGVSPTTPRT